MSVKAHKFRVPTWLPVNREICEHCGQHRRRRKTEQRWEYFDGRHWRRTIPPCI